jgi:hypothetical protein
MARKPTLTEAEWVAGTNPLSLVQHLCNRARAGRRPRRDRKLRRYACACGRRVWDLLTDERSRAAVEMAERFAEGEADRNELDRARSEAHRARDELQVAAMRSVVYGPAQAAVISAAAVSMRSCAGSAAMAAREAALFVTDALAAAAGEPRPVQMVGPDLPSGPLRQVCDLLRDVFSNPFRPVACDPSWLRWRGSTVVRLAQAAYEDRALPTGTLEPARLAVLADALEEAGCADAELLGHLRSPGPHLCGCWAVDLLLGRS